MTNNSFNQNRNHSASLTFRDAVKIWKMLNAGIIQSKIAAHFDVNQGRISEIKKGIKFPSAKRAALEI